MTSLTSLNSILAKASVRISQLRLSANLRRSFLVLVMLVAMAVIALLSFTVFHHPVLTTLHSIGVSTMHLLNQAPYSDPWP
ncbi:MAG TPA: hypothetical protein VFN23_05915 [Ktedonobacteraceae bacterium]|nr:hypothetical protein [Ktedonobacteraceae bacterium]